MNIRELVYKSLLGVEKSGKYSNLELTSTIEHTELDNTDKAFYTYLFYGITERKITLDYWIKHFTGKNISRLDTSVVIILRMGIFQIVFAEKIPDSAAVNESVKLANRYAARAKGLINGTLRSICRAKESLPYPDKKTQPISWASIYYSVPQWICSIWERDYGIKRALSITEALSKLPDLTLQVNTLKTSVDEFIQKYPQFKRGNYAPNAIRCSDPITLSDFEPLISGECFVQDEASQMTTMILDPMSGMNIIDVCAAPGGKSFSAAIRAENKATIISTDLHASKLSLIRDGSNKLGISTINVFEHDSTQIIDEYVGKFDRVICDVPCSGLGVIAKKSDLRYKDSSTLDTLPEIQYNILKTSANYLKSGGILVYSTCTLRKAENEDIVSKFINENSGFELVPFEIGDVHAENGMYTFFPDVTNTDGFFAAKIKRI